MPTKYVVAGVNGTGSREWRRTDGRNSHVFRFIADVVAGGSGDISRGVSSTDDAKRYWHGPGTFATDLSGIIDEVFEFVVSQTDRLVRETGCAQSDVKICLVGHSRGCVAAIKVANRLNDPGIVSLRDAVRVSLSRLRAPVAVPFIGLYDTVNRSLVDIDVAMPNVAAGIHTRRKNRSWSGSRFSFDTVEIPRFPPLLTSIQHTGAWAVIRAISPRWAGRFPITIATPLNWFSLRRSQTRSTAWSPAAAVRPLATGCWMAMKPRLSGFRT